MSGQHNSSWTGWGRRLPRKSSYKPKYKLFWNSSHKKDKIMDILNKRASWLLPWCSVHVFVKLLAHDCYRDVLLRSSLLAHECYRDVLLMSLLVAHECCHDVLVMSFLLAYECCHDNLLMPCLDFKLFHEGSHDAATYLISSSCLCWSFMTAALMLYV